MSKENKKPNKPCFTIHEFVVNHSESEIKDSNCFRRVGKAGHEGWMLKDSTKKILKEEFGFTPMGETRAMYWNISAWEAIEVIMARCEIENDDSEVGTPMSDAECCRMILLDILEEVKKFNAKWN